MTAQPDDMPPEAAGRCGTYGMAQWHRKHGQPLDQACRDAYRDYMRDYRSRKGPENDRWWVRTHNAALRRLAAEYPARFYELLTEIREAEPRDVPDDRNRDSNRAGGHRRTTAARGARDQRLRHPSPLLSAAAQDYGSEGWGFESLRARRAGQRKPGP